jgi:hypothetical protein
MGLLKHPSPITTRSRASVISVNHGSRVTNDSASKKHGIIVRDDPKLLQQCTCDKLPPLRDQKLLIIDIIGSFQTSQVREMATSNWDSFSYAGEDKQIEILTRLHFWTIGNNYFSHPKPVVGVIQCNSSGKRISSVHTSKTCLILQRGSGIGNSSSSVRILGCYTKALILAVTHFAGSLLQTSFNLSPETKLSYFFLQISHSL